MKNFVGLPNDVLSIFLSWPYAWVCTPDNNFSSIEGLRIPLDSNISEHSHLFDELQEQLAGKFHSIIIKLRNTEQYSSIHNILKMTKTELNKVL